MPLWLEIEILLMLTYSAGLGIGWLFWGWLFWGWPVSTRIARAKSEKSRR